MWFCQCCWLTFDLLPDLLVLGTGTHVQRIPADITALLQRRGIALEVQDTVRTPETVTIATSLPSGPHPPLSPLSLLSLPSPSFQPNACATFNFLLGEGRPAGAALIPPNYIPP